MTEGEKERFDDDAFRMWVSDGPQQSPNYLGRKGATLKPGPRVCKTASISLYGDSKTQQVRKRELRFSSYPRKGGQFDFDSPENTWYIEDDEIERLLAFLNADVDHTGRYRVVDAQSPAADVLDLLETCGDNMREVLGSLAEAIDPALVSETLSRSAAGITAAELAVLATRRELVRRASELARENGVTEQAMQRAIGDAWWIFGGRYIRVLERRDLLSLDQHDIPLITADGSLHIVELKSPQIPALVRRHRNHWIVGAEVHEATMQAANYIRSADELGLQLQTLVSEELGIDVKLRRVFATVVIGHRDHIRDPGVPPDQLDLALRTYNANLSRVEVVTFDQLFGAANRSLQFQNF